MPTESNTAASWSTPRRPWQRIWVGLIAFGCLVLLAGAPLPHVDSDAALFGTIAKTIVATGEWFTLHHPARPEWIVDKPPLTFWLMAISLRLGGNVNASLRLWQLLMAVALVLVTYRLARQAADRATLGKEEALLAALLLLTFQQVFYFANTPQQDIPLTLFLALALDAYLGYRRSGSVRAATLAGVGVAFGVLSKGIVALAVFGLIVLADLIVSRLVRERGLHGRLVDLAAGAAACALIAAPWFVVGAIRQGAPFVETFLFGENSIERFFRPFFGAGVLSIGGTWLGLLAYVPLLMVGMLPWTGLLPGVSREMVRRLRSGPPALRLYAVWFVVYFGLVSLSQGDKILRYLLPCYPPLAVLSAHVLVRALDRVHGLRSFGAVSLLLGVPLLGAGLWLLFGYAPQEFRLYAPLVLPSLLVFAGAMSLASLNTLRGRTRESVAALAAGALLSYSLTTGMVMQRWEHLWPWRAVAAAVHRLHRPGDAVLVLGSHGVEVNFASFWIEAPVAEVADERAFLRAWTAGRVFGLLSPDAYARLGGFPAATVLMRMPVGWVLVTNVR